MKTKVPVGLATILGLVGTGAAIVTSVVQSLEANQAVLTGQSKPAGILGAVLLSVVVGGRMFQGANPGGSHIVGEVVSGASAVLSAEDPQIHVPDSLTTTEVPVLSNQANLA
jgi:hypothetical protein